MIGKRVSEVNAKYADYDDLKAKAGEYDKIQESCKSELQKATERADKLQKQLDDINKANNINAARAYVGA